MTFFPDKPIAIDLFAGAGGFSLGIEQAGFEVVLAVEQDPVHAAVHAYNFPQTRVIRGDVAQLKGEDILPFLPAPLDLIIGGPPCQGFSVMGKRNLKDNRNELIFAFCRLVQELQPRYFIMENVPGLSQGKNKSLLRRLKRKFKAAGYRITEPVQILNAADFGVPQDRKRLFLLGTRAGEKLAAYPHPFSAKVTVRDAIADLPNLDDFPELASGDEVLLKPQCLEEMEALASPYVQQLRGLSDRDDLAYPRYWNPHLLTNSWQTQHTEAIIERFKTLKPTEQDPISRLRRLAWDGRCYTLRAGTNADRGSHTSARPLHPEYDRTISVREAARLHSFPDWFRCHATKWHGFRQVGNAVPPHLARVLGQQIIAAMGAQPQKPDRVLTLGDRAWLNLTHQRALKLTQTWIV
jgi:DNA (cytosine-5)-methyltransferase 1